MASPLPPLWGQIGKGGERRDSLDKQEIPSGLEKTLALSGTLCNPAGLNRRARDLRPVAMFRSNDHPLTCVALKQVKWPSQSDISSDTELPPRDYPNHPLESQFRVCIATTAAGVL